MALHRRTTHLLFLCLILASNFMASKSWSAVWPFDQRQVLLVHIDGTEFPSDLTTAQIMDIFVERGRVRWITKKAGPGRILPISVPRDFVWNRFGAVRSLGLKYKSDGIVVLLEKGSKIDMRWYSVSDGRPLYFETLYLPNSSGTPEQDAMRRKRLRSWLLDIWGKIPGQGYVVKRDMQNLFIEGVNAEGIKVGDRLRLLRLQKAKRHPILKTLVGFESSDTGFAKVTEVGNPFAQARIEYESDLDPIQEGDRYILASEKIVEKSEKPGVKKKIPTDEVLNIFSGFDSHIIDITPRAGLGFLKYEETTSAEAYEMRTLSYSAGFSLDLHVTKSWLVSITHDFGTGSFGSPPSDYGASAIGSGWTHTNYLTGYRMDLGDYAGIGGALLDIFGGYSKFKLKMADGSAAVSPTAKTYSGIAMGINIGMPIDQKWTANVKFKRAFGAFMSEAVETSGATSGNSLWSFDLTGSYKWSDIADIGGTYGVAQATSTFDGSGTRTTPAVSSKASASRFSVFYKMKM